MWLFGKRVNISKVARDEEEEELEASELPSFAPEILVDEKVSQKQEFKAQRAQGQCTVETLQNSTQEPEQVPVEEQETEPWKDAMDDLDPFFEDASKEELPGGEKKLSLWEKAKKKLQKQMPEEEQEENELPVFEEDEEEALFLPPQEPEQVAQEPLQAVIEEPQEDLPEEITEEEEESFEEAGADPRELYEQLKALPYAQRNYGLYQDKMLMIHPDGDGGLYFFEEFGDYNMGSPDQCKAFVRIKGLKGRFKGKNYATSDLEYVISKKAWPVCVLARNNAQYRSAIDRGYKPYKRSADGKGILLCTDISLYRIKDLSLRVELTVPTPVLSTVDYQLTLPRTILEGVEGEKQFKKLCKAVCEYLLTLEDDARFAVQVLKVRKNIAVCFPLQGMPKTGDLFADGVITAVAPAADGTLLLQIGNDTDVVLPLKEGGSYKGQRQLALSE